MEQQQKVSSNVTCDVGPKLAHVVVPGVLCDTYVFHYDYDDAVIVTLKSKSYNS